MFQNLKHPVFGFHGKAMSMFNFPVFRLEIYIRERVYFWFRLAVENA